MSLYTTLMSDVVSAKKASFYQQLKTNQEEAAKQLHLLEDNIVAVEVALGDIVPPTKNVDKASGDVMVLSLALNTASSQLELLKSLTARSTRIRQELTL